MMENSIRMNFMIIGALIGFFFSMFSDFAVGWIFGGALGYAIGNEVEKRYD